MGMFPGFPWAGGQEGRCPRAKGLRTTRHPLAIDHHRPRTTCSLNALLIELLVTLVPVTRELASITRPANTGHGYESFFLPAGYLGPGYPGAGFPDISP